MQRLTRAADVACLALLTLTAGILCIASSVCAGQAQADNSASVQGTIRDAHQNVVSDVVVVMQAEPAGSRTTARTSNRGQYRFAGVVPGKYNLSASAPGTGSASYGPLILSQGASETIDLTLSTGALVNAAPFFDQPSFVVAGVSESSGAGGHGSDAIRRKTEDLTRATASLGGEKLPPNTTADTMGSSDQRMAQIRQAISHDDRADLHHQLATIQEQAGHPLEAVREYQRAAEMDANEPNLFDLGTELLKHGAAQPAVEVFTQGNRRFPASTRMLTGLGVAEFARGAYDEAIARICQATDLDPANPTPYLFLGQMQSVSSASSAEIVTRLSRFASLQPKSALANYYYAVALWNRRTSDRDDAVLAQVEALLNLSVTLDPKLALAPMQIGILQSARHQFPAAVDAYQRTIAVDPNLPEAHYRLAQTYRLMGDREKSQQEFAVYERVTETISEQSDQDRKAMQRFVYELKKPDSVPDLH